MVKARSVRPTSHVRRLYSACQVPSSAEMVQAMKHVAMLNTELTVEERNLLSVGYKNVIYSRRAAWRSVSSMEQKVESKTRKWQLVRSYRTEIEGELETICVDLLQLLETHLLPATTSQEAKVLYHKMYV